MNCYLPSMPDSDIVQAPLGFHSAECSLHSRSTPENIMPLCRLLSQPFLVVLVCLYDRLRPPLSQFSSRGSYPRICPLLNSIMSSGMEQAGGPCSHRATVLYSWEYLLTSKRYNLIGSWGKIPAFRRQISICSSTVSTPSKSGRRSPLRPPLCTMTPYLLGSS